MTVLRFAIAIAAVVIGYLLGDGYIDRLPNHAGYHLVAVDDRIEAPTERPRHTVLVVIDGLGHEEAEPLPAFDHMEKVGACVKADVGRLTVSRPVYAVLSTGLEQDRTGSRNNDETSPLAVDSIWQSARRAGLRVTAVSEEPFWRQLFVDGFSDYVELPVDEDYFARAELADLTLIHPIYVDHAGHKNGAGSNEYRAAAQRVSQELLGLFERLDFERDALIVTADHGHALYGGHGASQPRIRLVKTCFVGRGFSKNIPVDPVNARVVAPTLAFVLGVPFPKHMNAVEDDLDDIFEIVDVDTATAAYVADRRAAVARFRQKNAAMLRTLTEDGTWSALYAAGHRRHTIQLAIFALLCIVVVVSSMRARRLHLWEAAASLAWMATTVLVSCAVYAWHRETLDFTSINARAGFLEAAFVTCGASAIVMLAAHRLILKRWRRLAADHTTLVTLAFMGSVAHVVIFGAPMGFPLPNDGLLFFGFLGPIFTVLHGLLAIVTNVLGLVFER